MKEEAEQPKETKTEEKKQEETTPAPAVKKATSLLGNVDHCSLPELKLFLSNCEQDYSDCLEDSDYQSLAHRFID